MEYKKKNKLFVDLNYMFKTPSVPTNKLIDSTFQHTIAQNLCSTWKYKVTKIPYDFIPEEKIPLETFIVGTNSGRKHKTG